MPLANLDDADWAGAARVATALAACTAKRAGAPLPYSTTIACPYCRAGSISYRRTAEGPQPKRGPYSVVSMACSTAGCVEVPQN